MDQPNQPNQQSNLKEIGRLWAHQDKNKKTYFSGTIDLGKKEVLSVLIFANANKGENPKRPDYQVFITLSEEDAKLNLPARQIKAKPSEPVVYKEPELPIIDITTEEELHSLDLTYGLPNENGQEEEEIDVSQIPF